MHRYDFKNHFCAVVTNCDVFAKGVLKTRCHHDLSKVLFLLLES